MNLRLLLEPTRFAVAAAMLASLFACTLPLKAGRPDPAGPPLQAEDAVAQERFVMALARLEEGRYDEAADDFRLLQTEYQRDRIAPLAELYVARAGLGQIGVGEDAGITFAQPDRLDAAISAFDEIASGRRQDERVRFAAKLYAALARSAKGKSEDGLAVIADYPSAAVSGIVLDEDRTAAWMLLTEVFWRADRSEQTLIAADALHEAAIAELSALGAPEESAEVRRPASSDAGLQVVLAYALGRGFEAARGVDEPTLKMKYATAERAFLQAAAGVAVLERALTSELDDDERPAMEAIYSRTTASLTEIGDLARVAELSTRLATAGVMRKMVVGVLVPLTGKRRAIGREVLRGVLLAQRAWDPSAPPQLTLMIRDSEAQADENMAAFEAQGAVAIIGPTDQDLLGVYSPLAESTGIPMLTLTTQAFGPREVDGAPGPMFRQFLSAKAEAEAAATLALSELGVARVAIAYPGNPYGILMAQTFAAKLRALGGELVMSESYDRSGTDYTALATKVARAKPGAVFIPDSGDKVAEVTAFMARQNVWGAGKIGRELPADKRTYVRYLGTSLWQIDALTTRSASYVQGAVIPAWYSTAPGDEAAEAFASRYRAVYDAEPQAYAVFAYDAVRWLRELVLERGVQRPVSVRDALARAEGFEGLTGKVVYNPWGEPDRLLGFVTVSGDAFGRLSYQTWTRAKGSPASEQTGEGAAP